MKVFKIAQLVLISTSLAAQPLLANSTSDSARFTYSGGDKLERGVLRTSVYRTEYRTETVASTCWRRELSGYRQECRRVPYTRCENTHSFSLENAESDLSIMLASVDEVSQRPRHPNNGGDTGKKAVPRPPPPKPKPGYRPPPPRPNPTYRPRPPRPHCHTAYRTECRQVPYYRDVAYTCYRDVTHSYQVLDHHFEGRFEVNFERPEGGAVTTDEFEISARGHQVDLAIKRDSKTWLYVAQRNDSSAHEGNTQILNVHYNIKPVSVDLLQAPFTTKVDTVQLNGTILSFQSGRIMDLDLVNVSLKVAKKKFLKDETYFEGTLTQDILRVTDLGTRTQIELDLADLGIADKLNESGDLGIEIKLKLADVPGTKSSVLNSKALTKTETQTKVKIDR